VACKLGNELVEIVKKLDMNIRYHQIYQGLDHRIQVPEEIDDMISVLLSVDHGHTMMTAVPP
jgi:sensor histidine kinase YesM